MWAYISGRRRVRAVISILGVSLLGVACSPKKITVVASCKNRISVLYNMAHEKPYCSETKVYADAVTISGNASYEALTDTSPINYLDTVTTQPIRYAEIEVLDSLGNRVQCGHTDGSGQFSVQVPRSTATHTIRVNSRAYNSQVRASVLNCPEENGMYSVSRSFAPDVDKTVGTLTAPVTETISHGGAFNILDQFVNANDFLRSKVADCSAKFTNCPDFTVAPKVSAYWAPGFNPNSYFNEPNEGLSFYLPGYSRLFIMGGVDGDMNNEDTDHFDNSVILHEYGHFLEDVYSKTDSPGGSHYGDRLIDPRLAWSEGWGNFLQAAIQDLPYYRDSFGNKFGTSRGYFFNIPLENVAQISAYCSDPYRTGCDMPEYADEGNFREFSVTRLLWDIFDGGTGGSDDDGDAVNDGFFEIWGSITSTVGFKNPLEAFRAIGFLHEVQDTHGSNDWSSVRANHDHGFTTEYARYVVATPGGCGTTYPYEMNPLDFIDDDGSFATSHLLRNNDFFFFKHSGGSVTLQLNYRTKVLGAQGYTTERESDLDLFVYNSKARYGNATDMLLVAQKYFDNNASTTETESGTTNLPAGDYLINVKVYTGRYTGQGSLNGITHGQYISAGTELEYNLKLNGVDLCPSARP